MSHSQKWPNAPAPESQKWPNDPDLEPEPEPEPEPTLALAVSPCDLFCFALLMGSELLHAAASSLKQKRFFNVTLT